MQAEVVVLLHPNLLDDGIAKASNDLVVVENSDGDDKNIKKKKVPQLDFSAYCDCV